MWVGEKRPYRRLLRLPSQQRWCFFIHKKVQFVRCTLQYATGRMFEKLCSRLITGFAFTLPFEQLGQVAVYFLDSWNLYLQPLVCKFVVAEIIRRDVFLKGTGGPSILLLFLLLRVSKQMICKIILNMIKKQVYITYETAMFRGKQNSFKKS